MLDTLIASCGLLLSISNFIALFAGVVIGLIVGAIPGMTVVMAVALALPFTFGMPPLTSLLLLIGIYKGGIYGGSITAITIKTPGTAAAACTVLDGYALTQKGQSRKALDMALYASIAADVISNLSLILFTGLLASLALDFGPPEYFTLGVFALTIIAGVSGSHLLNGVSAAMLGLLFATVGLDLLYGQPRLTFNRHELFSGLSFVPMLIGLFALPEIIGYYAETQSAKKIPVLSQAQGEPLRFKEFIKYWRTILRGSIIGVIIGAIPGLGATPSSFLSYSEARRKSAHPERFGTGELEGVAAAESGNNGVAGSTLIPLLSLGIPGDVVTAILLGAFMIHDLKPGPLLFQENLDIVYALFLGILASSPFLFISGKIAIRIFSKITEVPRQILFPGVFAFCLYGTYAVNSSIFDVAIMLGMGILGYIMRLCSVPPAPFVIAFILGPMVEDGFRQSMITSDNDPTIFFSSPITIIFWLLTLASIVFSWKQSKALKNV
ncbi:MAG: tripartite tricarboxylate transporter permease [Desulfovibrionaceae bacterium]